MGPLQYAVPIVKNLGEQRTKPRVSDGTDDKAFLTWLASNDSKSAYYSRSFIDLNLAYAGDNVWLSSHGTEIFSIPMSESTTFSVVGDGT